MKTSSELKQVAKQGLKGKYGQSIGAMFLYMIMSMVPLCGPAMNVGYVKYNLRLVRQENSEASNVFEGFSVFGKALWLAIITAFFLSLWFMLFYIPGIIKALSYSMAPYILADNPNMTAREALRASKQLMVGKKGKLFWLGLTFIGWFLLGSITLGIAYIWIIPYMQATIAAFYNDAISGEKMTGETVKNEAESVPAAV
ncbi:MAG: DUF975 family protein [Clostridia bacterium]|nr:DUF975 family protein [Clostridia bacterium]